MEKGFFVSVTTPGELKALRLVLTEFKERDCPLPLHVDLKEADAQRLVNSLDEGVRREFTQVYADPSLAAEVTEAAVRILEQLEAQGVEVEGF